MSKVYDTFTVKDARIFSRNFSGRDGEFNPTGRRRFCLELDPELGEELLQKGWLVKVKDPLEEGGDPFYFIQVDVSFEHIPPTVECITGRRRKRMTEATIGELDFANIERIDLKVRPYNWDFKGRQGVKAYLSKMFVKLEDDELDELYADIPYIDDPVPDTEEFVD